jgi:signal transduction histidine kinase
MSRKKLENRRAMLSWLFSAAMVVLCGYLGFLQYLWIGEVSVAERDRMQQRLQLDLDRLSRDFNNEIAAACRALAPMQSEEPDADFSRRYLEWRTTSRHAQLFRALALAVPEGETVVLRGLDVRTGVLRPMEWPAAWKPLRESMESHLAPPQRWPGGHGPGPRPPGDAEGTTIEIPLFVGRGSPPFRPRELGWAIFDVDPQYVRETMLPELILRNLGGNDYQVDVVTRTDPPTVIYQSDPNNKSVTKADASVGLFDAQFQQFLFRRDGVPRGMAGPPPSFGRWTMFVRHRAGSLEAVVERTRRRNLAVTGGVILLLGASIFALVRFTRNAQRLARLQLDFVAGVSHELRTPLAVIHGAAYNLRGTVAQNPAQVERYGALLQQESGRLKELVEQVLSFSGAQAGQVTRTREPLSIGQIIDDTIESAKVELHDANFVVEKKVAPDLPPVNGDPLALKHALQNLVSNAVKYGQNGDNWLGVFAGRAGGDIEIRVADKGPGIPTSEQKHIFDPFFRGKKALQDQIHGTGLGLNLVKKIIEAHGGTIRVQSEHMKGAEFIVRIPAAVSDGETA